MSKRTLSRRHMLGNVAGFSLTGLSLTGLSLTGMALPGAAWADKVIDLQWPDLMPKGQTALPPSLQGFLGHDSGSLAAEQPISMGVVTDFNGAIVRLSGFVIPLDYEGTGITVFMLVPYVGACIHVPPPPANQLVLVTTEKPYENEGLFEAVTVTGMFGTATNRTQIADVGYALSADKIERYQ